MFESAKRATSKTLSELHLQTNISARAIASSNPRYLSRCVAHCCYSVLITPMRYIFLALLLGQLCVLQPQPCAAFTEEAMQAIIPLAQLATNALTSGQFTDLSGLGGPGFAIDSTLLSWLQQAVLEVFSMDDAGLSSWLGGDFGFSGLSARSFGPGPLPGPPMLAPLGSGHPLAPWAKSHDKMLRVLADKWAAALVKKQFSPGLQGFLKLLGLTELQEALVKWVCIIYPWKIDRLIPQPIRDVRDSYCIRALPAAVISNILAGPPKPGKLPKPGPLGFGPLPLPGPGLPGPGILG